MRRFLPGHGGYLAGSKHDCKNEQSCKDSQGPGTAQVLYDLVEQEADQGNVAYVTPVYIDAVKQ